MATPWLSFTAVFDLADFENTPASADVMCEIETPLVWAQTGKIVAPQSKTKRTVSGKASFVLPFSDQSGFTAGYGGASIIGFGFRFSAYPTKSKPLIPGTETFVQIPQSRGPVVNIGNQLNIGAWPHAVITVVQGGGTTGGLTLVPAPGQPPGYVTYA